MDKSELKIRKYAVYENILHLMCIFKTSGTNYHSVEDINPTDEQRKLSKYFHELCIETHPKLEHLLDLFNALCVAIDEMEE